MATPASPLGSLICVFLLSALYLWVSLVPQMVKNLLIMQETQVWSLGWDDPLDVFSWPGPAPLPGMDGLGGRVTTGNMRRPRIWKAGQVVEELGTTHLFGLSGPWEADRAQSRGLDPFLGRAAGPGQPPSRAEKQ